MLGTPTQTTVGRPIVPAAEVHAVRPRPSQYSQHYTLCPPDCELVDT